MSTTYIYIYLISVLIWINLMTHQSLHRSTMCDCKIDWLWKWNIYIFVSSLWCQDKARRWVPLLNTQGLQNSAESDERSVLTLGFLCPPCCVRDTAWSWLLYIKCYFIFVIFGRGNVSLHYVLLLLYFNIIKTGQLQVNFCISSGSAIWSWQI